MSDMETQDVPVTDAAAPAEPTVEELQAELANLQAEVAAVEAAEQQIKPVAPPVVVKAQQPSSASETQQPESAPEVEKEPVSLEDAALRLATLVRDRRTTGDVDVDAALADVEAAIGQEIVSSSEAAIRAAAAARQEQDAQ